MRESCRGIERFGIGGKFVVALRGRFSLTWGSQ
jgi:hypothetical protein